MNTASKTTRISLFFTITVLFIVSLSSCNAFRGFGEDLEVLGEKMSGSSEKK